jgi:hypothetical protein
VSRFHLDRAILVAALVVTALMHKVHESAVDAVPENDGDVLRELMRKGYWAAFVLFVLALALEIGRTALAAKSAVALLTPAVIGLLGAIVTLSVRLHAHRFYELAAEDGDDERVRRALRLRRVAQLAFASSAALWGGLALLRAL